MIEEQHVEHGFSVVQWTGSNLGDIYNLLLPVMPDLVISRNDYGHLHLTFNHGSRRPTMTFNVGDFVTIPTKGEV